MEKEWFEQLTDAQKAKLKAMGNATEEQLIAFCKQEKLDLPDDMLETVSGGNLIIRICNQYQGCNVFAFEDCMSDR